MSITQTFYDNLASQYDKLFFDWQATTQEQAVILDKLFVSNGFDKSEFVGAMDMDWKDREKSQDQDS